MKKEDKKQDFDLSVLTLSELINLHDRVSGFLQYLEDQKIDTEENKGVDIDD